MTIVSFCRSETFGFREILKESSVICMNTSRLLLVEQEKKVVLRGNKAGRQSFW